MALSPIVSKKRIEDFTLKSRFCIYCKETFSDATIYEETMHKKGCPHHYYLICLSCGNKNSLAKLVENADCTCK